MSPKSLNPEPLGKELRSGALGLRCPRRGNHPALSVGMVAVRLQPSLAQIITTNILEVPYYNYSIVPLKTQFYNYLGCIVCIVSPRTLETGLRTNSAEIPYGFTLQH